MAAQPVVGGRWFIAGAVILLLFGAVHAAAVLASSFGKLDDAALVQLMEHEKSVRLFQKGPFTATAYGAGQILTTSYAFLLLFAGAADLLAMRPMARAGRLRSLIVLNIAMTAALAIVTMIWQFPPPMIFALAATICFVIALLRRPWTAPET